MINKEIIRNYVQGKLSKRELEEFQEYLQQHDLSVLEQVMREDWERNPNLDTKLEEALSRKMLQQIKQQTDSDTRTRRLLPRHRSLLKVAAAVAILLVAAVAIWWQTTDVGNGSRIIANRSDKVKEVKLRDGSRVWLNRNSQLEIDEHFGDRIRAVTLVGEAFFDVQTDSLKPFLVLTSDLQTRVLGTSFNVQALPKSNQVKIALIEGKVSVELRAEDEHLSQVAILSPGEMLTFRKQNKQTQTQQYVQGTPVAWRDGVIYFDGATVQEVTTVLAHWYNIDFTIENDTSMQSELVHRFDTNKMTLEQVLDGIARVTDYRFERKKRNEMIVKPD